MFRFCSEMDNDRTQDKPARADTLNMDEAWAAMPQMPWSRDIPAKFHEDEIHALARFISAQKVRMTEGDAVHMIVRAALIKSGDLRPPQIPTHPPQGQSRR